MPMFDATTKLDYERASIEAQAQERVVNNAYIEYHAKAKIVASMFTENGNEAPGKTSPEYRKYRNALVEKEAAYVAWQREAHKHGAMFVNLKRPERVVKKETVW